MPRTPLNSDEIIRWKDVVRSETPAFRSIPLGPGVGLTWDVIRRFMNKPKYPIVEPMASRLENDYKYHAPKEDQQERYVRIREAAKQLAIVICENTPSSREQSVALTDLDKVVMMANAAIARNE